MIDDNWEDGKYYEIFLKQIKIKSLVGASSCLMIFQKKKFKEYFS